jgi:hypothetical protein
MALDISVTPGFQAGVPDPLVGVVSNPPPGATPNGNMQVTADGKRFLSFQPQQQIAGEAPITVLLNWPALLNN